MNEQYTYLDLFEAARKPSETLEKVLDMDLMQLAMFTLDALNSLKAGTPVSVLRFKLDSLVQLANIAMKDLETETTEEQ